MGPVVRLRHAGLEVLGDVVEEAIPRGKEGGADAASPGALPLGVYDDIVGVRTCGAVVCGFVVLVERVGAPEDAVASGTRVPPVPLVELFLVALPVILAREGGFAGGAPISRCCPCFAAGLGRPP